MRRSRDSGRWWLGAFLVLLAQGAMARASAGDDIYRFGPLGKAMKAEVLEALSQLSVGENGRGWAVYAFYSQILPETWYAEVFLPPTSSTAMLRSGVVRHLECQPREKGTCLDWRLSKNEGRYIQVADGPGFDGGAASVRRASERPIRVEGEISDSDLVSLVRYIRSKPTPRSTRSSGSFVEGVSGRFPIMSIERLRDGSVWVRMSDDGGSGETATVRKTRGGWQVTEVGMWVA